MPVIRRTGEVTPFDSTKISVALTKAFLDVEGTEAAGSSRVRSLVVELTGSVEQALRRYAEPDRLVHLEEIQDQVELALMRGGHHAVARSYVLYREEHARARADAAPGGATGAGTPVANMSGDFTVINQHLVRDLAERGLWDAVMVGDLKYFDGALGEISRVPEDLKELYATAFEVDSRWLVEAAARRRKWLDQAQSLNLYIDRPDGRALDALYQLAWERGLKTTYYLRSQAATRVEKSTLAGTDGRLNAVAPGAVAADAVATPDPAAAGPAAPAACSIDDPDCEACQ
ncbi:MAG TPA: ATP cone domain-containing protein [Pseudonocardia sp.]|jgi:ribonucleotide reductase alpha subunit